MTDGDDDDERTGEVVEEVRRDLEGDREEVSGEVDAGGKGGLLVAGEPNVKDAAGVESD